MLHDGRTDRYYLVDCGSFQGPGSKQLSLSRFIDGRIGGIPCSKISALFLTHAHADHSGMLPQLVMNGFKGPIYCTEFTKWATLSTLYDSGKHNFEGYEEADVMNVQTLMRSVDEDEKAYPFVLGHSRRVNLSEEHLQYNFTRTSHLMGCVAIEFVYNDKPEGTSVRDDERIRVLFGADTGGVWDAEEQGNLVKSVQPPTNTTQTLILESTYGGRIRETLTFKQRIEKLAEYLEAAGKDKQSPVIVIPAFALQRTQEIILDLAAVLHFAPEKVPSLFRDGRPPTIVSSSRMANGIGGQIREEFKRLNARGKETFANKKHPLLAEARSPEELDILIGHLLCGDYDQELKSKFDMAHSNQVYPIKETGRCKIIIGSNGMCAGGGIVGVLRETLTDPETTVMLTGYQAVGTPGHTLSAMAKGDKNTKPEHFETIIGLKLPDVKATVCNIGSLYSGHADQSSLIRYCLKKDRDDKKYTPVSVVLVHGDNESRDDLRQALQKWDSENKEASRGLVGIFSPSVGSGWYDCKTRQFVTDSAVGDSEKLAELMAKHADLKAAVERHLAGDLSQEQLANHLQR
jgi:metallo-beta-lactamase family protein